MKRFLWLVSIILLMCLPVSADFIKWVDFDVPYESLQYAMNVDIDSFEEEQHISWIDILSLAACRTGGKCGLTSVKRAARELKQGKVPQDLLGEAFRYYSYYHEAYSAVLGGLLGSFAICRNGTWVPPVFSHWDRSLPVTAGKCCGPEITSGESARNQNLSFL